MLTKSLVDAVTVLHVAVAPSFVPEVVVATIIAKPLAPFLGSIFVSSVRCLMMWPDILYQPTSGWNHVLSLNVIGIILGV